MSPFTAKEQQALDLLQHDIEAALASARALAMILGRGPGGRENALTITQLQQAGHWHQETSSSLAARQE